MVLIPLAIVKREIEDRPDRDWDSLGLDGDQVYEAFKTAPGRRELFGGLR